MITESFGTYARIVSLAASIPLLAAFENVSFGQLFWNTNGTSNTLTATNWGTVAGGPFTTAWTAGSNITFTANSTITNVTVIPVGNLTIADGVTVNWTAAGTYSTGLSVRTFDIGTGSTLNWNSQNVSSSAGTGFIKNGAGTWNIGTMFNNVPGGFTLNAGTIIAGGTNAVGAGALNLNGGIIATNSTAARNLVVTSILFGGNVQLGDSVNVPAGTGNLGFVAPVNLGNATRTMTIGNNATQTFSGIVSNGGVTIAATPGSTGSIVLSGVNTYTGGTNIDGGILTINNANALSSAGTISFGGGTLRFGTGITTDLSSRFSNAASQSYRFDTNAQNITLANNLTSSGGTLTKLGTGTLTLSGSNSYTGNTTISTGVLSIASAAALPGFDTSGRYSVASGAALAVGNFVTDAEIGSMLATTNFVSGSSFGFNTTTADRTYSAVLADTSQGPLGLVKLGTNTLTLTGDNIHTGMTDVRVGTLTLGRSGGTIGDTSPVQVSGGILDVANSDTVGAVTLSSGTISGAGTLTGSSYAFTNSGTISASLSGTGSLTKTGSGTVALSGTNTYSGGTTVTAGNLSIASVSALPGFDTNGSFSVTGGAALVVGDNVTDTEIGLMLGTTNFVSGSSFGFDTTAADRTYSAVLGNTALGLAKLGTNTLTLTGDNLYTGLTDVREGTLTLGRSGGTIADTSAVQVSGGTLNVANSDTVGAVTLSSGTISGTGTLTGSSYAFTNSGTVSAILGGSGVLTKTGAGTVTLSGTNSYTGGTTITAGVLSIGNANALGTAGLISFGGGTLQFETGITTDLSSRFSNTGAQAYNFNTNGNDVTIGSILAATTGSTLTKGGAGTLTLSRDNTYVGLTTINGGTLAITTNNALGTSAGNVLINPGTTLQFVGNGITNADLINLNGNGVGGLGAIRNSNGVNTQAGQVNVSVNSSIGVDANSTLSVNAWGVGGSAAVTLTKVGDGELNLVGAPVNTGGITISAGTLSLASSNRLPNTGPVTVGGGELRMNTFTDSVGLVTLNSGSITGTGAGALTSLSGGYDVRAGSVSAILAGTLGLTKSTGGTVTLSGANTYTGVTTVSAGTLTVNGSLPSASAVTVASGATLNGTGTIFGTTNINGIHAPGTSPGIQTIFGDLTYGSTSTLQWELLTNDTVVRGTNFDGINGGGLALNINPGATSSLVFNGAGSSVNWNDSFWQIDRTWNVFSGYSTGTDSFTGLITVGNDSAVTPNVFGTGFTTGGSFSWIRSGGDLNLQYTAVPEPSSIFLVSGMAMCVGLYARRHMKKGASSVPQDSNDD